ncbi:MAG: hypothetical protein DWQ10_02930 [Calditrichaeota bacterium]|nr:MAG: hypothetical protein DWQ10_02930 [Calditrichota bacterium]
MIARAYRHAIGDLEAGKPFNPEHLRDVFATANKGFIAGFLHGNPGKSAQKFDNTKSEIQAYRFSGIVRDYDANNKLMQIEPRNPIYLGQKLELCSGAKDIEITVERIVDEKGKEMEQIHGGLHTCWIPYDEAPAEFSILREQINEFDPSSVELSMESIES